MTKINQAQPRLRSVLQLALNLAHESKYHITLFNINFGKQRLQTQLMRSPLAKNRCNSHTVGLASKVIGMARRKTLFMPKWELLTLEKVKKKHGTNKANATQFPVPIYRKKFYIQKRTSKSNENTSKSLELTQLPK